jgi:restriction endonuclease Mrr
MVKKKVSFDFDSTLDREDVQEFAKQLVKDGYEVWITTSRFDTESSLKKGWWWIEKNNQQLYDIAEECGIPKENISFTAMIDKIKFLEGKNFIFHLDDDETELEFIEESDDKCVGVWVELKTWKKVCNNLIK